VQRELGIIFAGRQTEALKTALSSQVMVITGGPGTGKTTLIKAIMKIRSARGYKIMLAAPTGRAAKRMTEATGHEAKTIHRMLEYTGSTMSGGDFMRNETNPLDCDLLVVDEASMIDQVLFHHLLKAVPKGSSVIFVGDVDQLPSVGPGNVLKDIIDSGVCPVVHLNEIYRQSRESMIVVNAHRVNNGEMPCLDEKGEPSSVSDFYFIEEGDPDRALEIIKTLVTVRMPQKFGLDPVKDIQVLTPMHRGSLGTARLNSELRETLNTCHGSKVLRMGRTLQEGDKVMQIRNNYEKDVYNGDIGTVVMVDGEESRVIVEMDSGRVSYDFSELDELIHAYAVSIHKSQGSEYPAVVIPIMTQHYMMLQRNLLYTAITRGKKLVVIIGTKKAVAIAVNNDKTRKRYTRLAERLKSCFMGG
jgi:exodeoxyribonuclease V alpha subunit